MTQIKKKLQFAKFIVKNRSLKIFGYFEPLSVFLQRIETINISLTQIYYCYLFIHQINKFTGTNLKADVFKGNYSLLSYRQLSITILNLGYNRIQSIDHHAFEHLPHLRELHLDGNPLGTIDYTTSVAINSIQRLEVFVLYTFFYV